MIYKFLLVFAIIRPTFSQFSPQFDASQCEISKGCHIPEPSQSNGMGVAWNLLDDETLELELFVNAEQENGRYVAVGFSDDEQMVGGYINIEEKLRKRKTQNYNFQGLTVKK